MKDYIISKSFNSSVSYAGNKSKAILNFERVYNPTAMSFDYCDQLFPRIKQKYNLVKAIGEKDNYSEKEAKTINNFFTFAVASNVFALEGKLKYQYAFTTSEKDTLEFRVAYYVGTQGLYVPATIQRRITYNDKKYFPATIIVETEQLNNNQMKKFIKLLNDSTFETFSIGFYQEKKAS